MLILIRIPFVLKPASLKTHEGDCCAEVFLTFRYQKFASLTIRKVTGLQHHILILDESMCLHFEKLLRFHHLILGNSVLTPLAACAYYGKSPVLHTYMLLCYCTHTCRSSWWFQRWLQLPVRKWIAE